MKFKIPPKRYSLEYFGDEWKGCYIDFTPITIGELDSDIIELSLLQTGDPAAAKNSKGKVSNFLKSHFIEGYAINENGKKTKLKAEDIVDLPAEVLMGVLGFLSQSQTEDAEKQSLIPSQAE